jgi:23S rRNA-/tRNA-specific pseudouridylate synthase
MTTTVASQQPARAPLVILDEGPHHVIVYKDADTVVVRGRGTPSPTLLDRVQDEIAPAALPVHRLDRGTSGCCAFAKTAFGQQALSDAFRRHLVEKRYLCIVEGVPNFTSLVVDARLLRHDQDEGKKGPLAWQTVDEKGQRALTRLSVLAKGDGQALVLARPETGRMHQIRAHLAHTGFPIVGDSLYGSTVKLLPHINALHAWMLALPRPEGGGSARAVASLPEYFVRVLDAAGIDARAIVKAESEQFMKKVVQERAQPVKTTAKKSDRPTRKGPSTKNEKKTMRGAPSTRNEKKTMRGAPSTKNEKTAMKGDAKKRYGQKGNELRPQRTSVKNSNAGSRRR